MIDAHCHVDLFPDPHRVVRDCDRYGIPTIAVTNSPAHFRLGRPHLRSSRCVRLALGFHPILCEHTRANREEFAQLADKTSYIGEVGLDFSEHSTADQNTQRETLKVVLDALGDRPRIVSVHSRAAEEDTISLLHERDHAQCIFHWYSGPLSLLATALADGHYFSVNPRMTQSQTGRKCVAALPPDRVLTESDGPYVASRGKPVQPVDMTAVTRYLADVWAVSEADAEKTIDANFERLLRPIRGWQRKVQK